MTHEKQKLRFDSMQNDFTHWHVSHTPFGEIRLQEHIIFLYFEEHIFDENFLYDFNTC